MDPLAVSRQMPVRPEPRRGNSSGKVTRGGESSEDKGAGSKVLPSNRPMSYKEKFQTLREKYEHVTTDHTKYERELAIADEKVKKLQEECNLLLDAVDIAVPAQPSLIYYLSRDPIAQQYYSYTVPGQAGVQQPVPPQPARPRHRKTSSQTNGNSNGVKRPRHA